MDKPLLDARLSDSLSPATSNSRKHLLVSSALGIAIAKMEIVPNKISALGIEFNDLNKVSFTYLIAAICCYFAISFITYAINDFLQWRSSVKQTHLAYGLRASMAGLDSRSNLAHSLASMLRIVIDYLLPVAVAGTAVYFLINVAVKI